MDNLEKSVRQIIEEVINGMDLNLPKNNDIKNNGVFSDIHSAIDAAAIALLMMDTVGFVLGVIAPITP